VEGLDEAAERLSKVGGRLWFQSKRAVFRVDGRCARAFPLPDPDVWVNRLEEVGSRVLLFTTRLVRSPESGSGSQKPGPVYVLGDDAAEIAPTKDAPVRFVKEIDGELWFVIEEGPAYRLRGGTLKAFPRQNAVVHDIVRAGGSLWLRAADGAYRVEKDRSRRLPNQPLTVWSIEERDGHALVLTQNEAYEIRGNRATEVPRPKPN
jgi:hypothetical protein